MIFPKTFEEKIGFDTIRDKIYNYCVTEGGKRLTQNMMFDSDFVEVKRKLSETEEIRQAILFHAPFPFVEFSECFDEIIRISTEGTVIEQHRIKDLKSTIDVYLNCSRYFNENKDDFPLAYSRDLSDNSSIKTISKCIDKIIDINGDIKDTASDELKDIRSNIRLEQSNANKLIGGILKKLKNDSIIKDDANTVIRNGRSVIPVPASNQKAVKGFIHDTSSSGQTVFIEPSEIFNINSNISSLYIKEKQEIFNILKNFTTTIQEEIPTIINMCNYLAYLDFVKSKANLAIEIDGSKPNIINKPIIIWYKAKHPLLYLSLKKQDKKIVPLNIQLNKKDRIIVISGPNAGGKSIALKTVALIQYMIQTGNLVPLGATSESGIFEDIFIDIGDQQSIENDLSTYTSHLKNMKFFIEHANENSLILIDEIGSGTEPLLGSSIAEVCLEELAKSKAKGVVTTHFGTIKKAANDTNGLLNGAMLFDTKNIEPEFILETGFPGSSYTFEIAKRVGFPEKLLKKAKTKEVSDQIDYERLMSETLTERKKLEDKKEKLELADNFLKEVIDKYKSQLDNIEKNKKDIIRNAQLEAARIMESANYKIEQAVNEIKESNAEKEKTKEIRNKLKQEKQNVIKAAELEKSEEKKIKSIKVPKKVREKLEAQKTQKIEELKSKSKKNVADIQKKDNYYEKLKKDFPMKLEQQKKQIDKKVEEGDSVKAIGHDKIGKVVSIKGNNAKVNFGNIIMTLKTKNLQVVEDYLYEDQNISKANTNITNIIEELNYRSSNFKTVIDLRGLSAVEAIEELKLYIDDAIMLRVYNVSILHGKGNGILRDKVRKYLNSVKEVESYCDAKLELGGDGVTEVTFKASV